MRNVKKVVKTVKPAADQVPGVRVEKRDLNETELGHIAAGRGYRGSSGQ